ncbi:MAG: response regulator transcription factor [bacterium]
MIRLLLVEDDGLIGEMIRLNLQQEGYEVTWKQDGAAAREEILRDYDVILLDVMLPGCTGYELARELRGAGRTTPVLMLTARSDTSSKVTGLDAGADDYVTKPFDVPELLARVRALLRRSHSDEQRPAPHQLKLGSFLVDLHSGEAETLRGTAHLSAGEVSLLELLSRRRGQVLTLQELAGELASTGLPAGDALTQPEGVRETIDRLRDLFEPEPERPRHFVHVQSGGYRFES